MTTAALDEQRLRQMREMGIGRPISTMSLRGGFVPTSEEKIEESKPLMKFASAVLPGVSDVRDIGEVIGNRPFMEDRPLSENERIVTYMGAALPVISGSMMRKAVNLDWIEKLKESMRLEQGALAPTRFKLKIPGFKTQQEAMDFGRTANQEQVRRMFEMNENLDLLSQRYLEEARRLPDGHPEAESLFNEAMRAATSAQFLREALSVAPKGADIIRRKQPSISDLGGNIRLKPPK